MQLRKKRKKEREALGDKVSLHRPSDNFCAVKWHDLTLCVWNGAFHLKAPPKEVPKTIENQRVYDETTVDPGDEEVLSMSSWLFSKRVRFYFLFIYERSCFVKVAFDEATDEFSAYFNKLTNPKVLITTSDRPRGVSSFKCRNASVFVFQLKWVLHWLFQANKKLHWKSKGADSLKMTSMYVQHQHTTLMWLFSLRLSFLVLFFFCLSGSWRAASMA